MTATSDHDDLQRVADEVRAARAAGDETRLAAAFDSVAPDRLDELFARIDLPQGDAPTSPSAFERSLVGAGFDAVEAHRWAQLAAGGAGPVLAAFAADAAVDVDGVADRVVTELTNTGDLTTDAFPRVRRYVQRVLDGRHDFARLATPARAALLSACHAPAAVASILVDAVTPPRPVGLAAARGGAEAAAPIDGSAPRDATDALFDVD